MKADQQLQWRLLDLQAIDTRLGQIRHRTKNLPEAAQVAGITERIGEVDSKLTRARVIADDSGREAAKAENDVALVRERAARNQSRLDAGQGSAKDMQALTHELESLARRQSELEEVELEAMERVEAADASVAALEAERAPRDAQLQEAKAAQAAATADLDAEAAELNRKRADVSAGIGGELLALYEKIRETTGIGAAALRQRRCEACNMEIVAADMARVARAAADEVVRCEECRRILVRTAESGL